MICLDNTDVIEGGASVASVVDYTIHGLVGTTFTQLAAGTLSDTLTAVLYTAGAAISVVNITLVNTHSTAVNITLCLDPANAGSPRYMIPKTMSLGISYSLHTDGTNITVLDASGRSLKCYTLHASDHEDAGIDEINVAGLSGVLADDQHVIDAEVLAAAGENSGITTMTGLADDGIPPAKISGAIETATLASAVITDNHIVRGDGGSRGVQLSTAIIDDSGRMTNPSQPLFSTKVSTTQVNVTGNGTNYDVTGAGIWTESIDQGSNVTNGIFTAPIAGRYFLGATVYLGGIAAANTGGALSVFTSNALLHMYAVNFYTLNTNNQMLVTMSAIAVLDENDTANLRVRIDSGNKTVDVIQDYTYFYGYLIC